MNMDIKEKIESTQMHKHLESIFSNIKKETTKNGERWNLNENTVFYLDGSSDQGDIFKDEQAYEQSLDTICYISEYSYRDYEFQIQTCIQDYLHEHLTLEELCEEIEQAAQYYGDTHQDILNECNHQEEIASLVFESVNWQSVSTYVDELFQSNELAEFEGIYVYTRGMELEEYLYEEYKKEWYGQHQPPTYEEFLDKEFNDTNVMKALINNGQGIQFKEDSRVNQEKKQKDTTYVIFFDTLNIYPSRTDAIRHYNGLIDFYSRWDNENKNEFIATSIYLYEQLINTKDTLVYDERNYPDKKIIQVEEYSPDFGMILSEQFQAHITFEQYIQIVNNLNQRKLDFHKLSKEAFFETYPNVSEKEYSQMFQEAFNKRTTNYYVETPRGFFRFVDLPQSMFEKNGYSIHHKTSNGQFDILSNGTKAIAALADDRLKSYVVGATYTDGMDSIILASNPIEASTLAQKHFHDEDFCTKRIANVADLDALQFIEIKSRSKEREER